MQRIILLGPPGCGKGTQAARIVAAHAWAVVASGDMFRSAARRGTAVGLEAKRYMDAGELVPDATTIRLVSERLAQPDCAVGFVLDGFPRTIAQAEALGASVPIDGVLEIRCDDETIIRRLSGRRVHAGSGRVYHLEHNPPKADGVDDVTGEPLEQRLDDRPDTVRNRLAVYDKQTKPLSDYYANGGVGKPAYHAINGDEEISKVTEALLAAVGA